MVYPRKVPPELIRRFIDEKLWVGRTLLDFLDDTVASGPDRVAIVYSDRSYTFAEFRRISMHLAASLTKLGIGKGDIVSVQLPNCPQFMFLQVALSMIGAIINPMHLVLRKSDVYSMLNFCGSNAMVFPTGHGTRDFVDDYADIREKVPTLERLILLGDREGGLPEGAVAFDELTAHEQGSDTVPARSAADDVFYLNFTSGTEGDPKGFLHTFNTMLSYSVICGTHLFGFTSDDTLLSFSALTHTMGHVATFHCAMQGAKVVLVDKYEPEEALKTIARHGVTYIQGTPAHFYGILNHPDFESFGIRSVRLGMTGGSLVPMDLLLKAREMLGAEILIGYGMGETMMHTITRPEDPDWAKASTVGRATSGVEIRIFDPVPSADDPKILIGEIGYRGPCLFIEYFRNPARTDETRDDEGWFRTGDLGYVDDQGYLRITGRKKDVINRGGTKIFPGEVENVLRFSPAIRDISIVGMPDSRMGERCCAFVITAPNRATVTLEDLQCFLKERGVTPYKWPERLELVTEFPMTPTGKVRKEDLRRQIEAKINNEGKRQ